MSLCCGQPRRSEEATARLAAEAIGLHLYLLRHLRPRRTDLLGTVIERYGHCGCAGGITPVWRPRCTSRILETTKEELFDRLININLKGTFFMCQT